VTYGESDGLASRNIFSIFEDQTGRINIANGRTQALSRFEKGIFVSVEPRYTAPIVNTGFRFGQIALQSRTGEWWAATNAGLHRFPAANGIEDLAKHQPVHVYGPEDGFHGRLTIRVYEDSHGNVWAASGNQGLYRWRRENGAFATVPVPNDSTVAA